MKTRENEGTVNLSRNDIYSSLWLRLRFRRRSLRFCFDRRFLSLFCFPFFLAFFVLRPDRRTCLWTFCSESSSKQASFTTGPVLIALWQIRILFISSNNFSAKSGGNSTVEVEISLTSLLMRWSSPPIGRVLADEVIVIERSMRSFISNMQKTRL